MAAGMGVGRKGCVPACWGLAVCFPIIPPTTSSASLVSAAVLKKTAQGLQQEISVWIARAPLPAPAGCAGGPSYPPGPDTELVRSPSLHSILLASFTSLGAEAEQDQREPRELPSTVFAPQTQRARDVGEVDTPRPYGVGAGTSLWRMTGQTYHAYTHRPSNVTFRNILEIACSCKRVCSEFCDNSAESRAGHWAVAQPSTEPQVPLQRSEKEAPSVPTKGQHNVHIVLKFLWKKKTCKGFICTGWTFETFVPWACSN